jgi:hypothetical protein
MLKAYPRLAEIVPPNTDNQPHLDSILRYICLLYDPKSPLTTGERDLNYRKEVAAQLAGFNSEKDAEYLERLFDSKQEWVVAMTMKYLIRFIKQRKWAYISAVENKYWEKIARLNQPIQKADKESDELRAYQIVESITDSAYKDLSRLDTLYSEFFGDDEELSKTAQNIRITPEMIATGNV